MPQLDPLFSQLQEGIASTSKAEIHRRINCVRGKKHFTKWTRDHQNLAIKACGLASSKYTNKQSRNKILRILSMADLPTGIAAVWQKIKEMRINASSATSLQQRAYLLLYNMVSPAVRAGMEKPPEPLPAKEIQGPGHDLLSREARFTLWDRMQKDGYRKPCAYYAPALRDLWIPRRQVLGMVSTVI
jgi:hypothetical protein